MEQKNCNIKKRKYTHLKEWERYKIEALWAGKKKPDEIALILKRSRSTIYAEITRGIRMHIDQHLAYKKVYRANVGQKDYLDKGKNKQRGLKIGKDTKLEAYIREKILKYRYSPDAIIGEIKMKGLKFEGMISTKTLYNYIEAGIFAGISNESLWEKRKRKKRSYQPVRRISLNNRTGKSIEQRPLHVNDRSQYGHWEGDCIRGPQGLTTSLFTLTERKSLEQIIIKIERGSQQEIKDALDQLEVRYGSEFKLKFKSITFDNGVEFLDWRSLELSSLNPKNKRTTLYFAHAYSAWERGSNENQNKIIRRFIPKGTDIHQVSDKEIKTIESWMNNYPRKRLGYKTANQVAQENLQINRIKGL
ncbi:MAG: IS30 family transposase [Candidatus Omnitrophica bacterium]|nr:IS30 family transposase [Candidatus Omnitrophota bacterium]